MYVFGCEYMFVFMYMSVYVYMHVFVWKCYMCMFYWHIYAFVYASEYTIVSICLSVVTVHTFRYTYICGFKNFSTSEDPHIYLRT